eukprot:756587-Hanusia_phi.AAC.3
MAQPVGKLSPDRQHADKHPVGQSDPLCCGSSRRVLLPMQAKARELLTAEGLPEKVLLGVKGRDEILARIISMTEQHGFNHGEGLRKLAMTMHPAMQNQYVNE